MISAFFAILLSVLVAIGISARFRSLRPIPLYLGLLEIIESHTLSVQALDEPPSLPDYIHSRYHIHADLVDAIADRNARALEIIHRHNISGPHITQEAAGGCSCDDQLSRRS